MGSQDKSFTNLCTKSPRKIPGAPLRWGEPREHRTWGPGCHLRAEWWGLTQRWRRCRCLPARRPGSTPSSPGRSAACFERRPGRGPPGEEKDQSRGLRASPTAPRTLHGPQEQEEAETLRELWRAECPHFSTVTRDGRRPSTLGTATLSLLVGWRPT